MGTLINKTVKHSLYGDGKVIEENDKRVVVDFSGNVRLFPMPDAVIHNYFVICDDYDTIELPEKESSWNRKIVSTDQSYREKYREEFRDWIVNYYNKNYDNVINDYKGYASDVFFIEKNCPERDFLTWFTSEETLNEAREALLKVPEVINGKQKPEYRVSGYITRMRIFRLFMQNKGLL